MLQTADPFVWKLDKLRNERLSDEARHKGQQPDPPFAAEEAGKLQGIEAKQLKQQGRIPRKGQGGVAANAQAAAARQQPFDPCEQSKQTRIKQNEGDRVQGEQKAAEEEKVCALHTGVDEEGQQAKPPTKQPLRGIIPTNQESTAAQSMEDKLHGGYIPKGSLGSVVTSAAQRKQPIDKYDVAELKILHELTGKQHSPCQVHNMELSQQQRAAVEGLVPMLHQIEEQTAQELKQQEQQSKEESGVYTSSKSLDTVDTPSASDESTPAEEGRGGAQHLEPPAQTWPAEECGDKAAHEQKETTEEGKSILTAFGR